MADYLVTDTELTSIANAIRTKGGTSASLEFPQEFVQAINDIQTGGGGEWTTVGVLMDTEPSGDIEITTPAVTLGGFGLDGKTGITSLIVHGAVGLKESNGPFKNMTGLRKVVLLDVKNTYQSEHFASSFVSDGTGICVMPSFSGGQYGAFGTNNRCGLLDLGENTPRVMSLTRSLSLEKLILRPNAVVTLNNVSNLNNTPFASNGAGGTLYVPSSQITAYQSATNWSTILGYANNSIQAIEGSEYEDPNWWEEY